MRANETRLAQLTRLLESGSVARSACSRQFLAVLAPLLDSGVLTEHRSGAGRRVTVVDGPAMRAFIRHHFPNAHVPENTSSRLAGVARFRNSKAIPNDSPEIVNILAWDDDALRCVDGPVSAAAASQANGVFSFLLKDARRFTLHGPCALVENPSVFNQFEQLGLTSRLAVYGRGRCSRRLLDWLATQTAPDFTLLHLPDYDPVGLHEFTRLKDRLGTRARLYFPENIADLFVRYANAELLQNPTAQSLLAKLRLCEIPELRTVVSLIEKYNAGLEQEALLIHTP